MNRVGLPDLANKNTVCLGKFEFQVNNEQFLGKYVSPAVVFFFFFPEIEMLLSVLYFIWQL